ncbi:MAG: hypothetical protein WA687_09075 [Solirubrobacterales bacterium]
MSPSGAWTIGGESSPVVLVAGVGTVGGSRAAAAALACAASEPDRAALLIDLDDGRAQRPSLIATAGSRRLEERLAAHMPDAAVASRGRFCQLTLPADLDGLEQIGTALPLARESAAVIHLAPALLRGALEETRVEATAALLRADLAEDRALTALAARDLMARGLRVAVLKRPLSWLTARAALLGALTAGGGALPARVRERLLSVEDNKLRTYYDGKDEPRGDRQEIPRQRFASARRREDGWSPCEEQDRA